MDSTGSDVPSVVMLRLSCRDVKGQRSGLHCVREGPILRVGCTGVIGGWGGGGSFLFGRLSCLMCSRMGHER